MRHLLFLLSLTVGPVIKAQLPVAINWTSILPYGSENNAPGLISIDQDTVAWMILDENAQWTTWDGIVREFLTDGTAITGNTPHLYIGCGSLDHYIDFDLRHDSLWGISQWQYLSGPMTYCANSPSGGFSQDAMENGELLHDGGLDLLVGSAAWFICAWHEVSFTQRDARIVALDMSDNVLWQVDLPAADYGVVHTLAQRGDTLVLGAFPHLHWLDATNGALLGSSTVYNGASRTGRVLWDGGHFLWAAHANDTLHYGKIDALGVPIFVNALPGSSVNTIARDAQDRLWIGGTNGTSGALTRISATGAVDGTWTYGASVTDMEFSNGQLFWAGRLLPNATESYLVCGTPTP